MTTPLTERPPAPTESLPPSDLKAPTARRPRLRRWLPVVLQLAVLAVIVLCPMFFILIGAFTDNAERDSLFDFGNFTLDNFSVLGSGTARTALLNSAAVGIGASIV
ncbi:MAG TPA: hypothetical protein VF477_17235, partial [Mycobacterium sp.]